MKYIPLIVICVFLAACAAPIPTAISTSTTIPTPSVTAAPTRRPTSTVAPTPTDIPSFEGWSVVNPQAVEITTENGSLIMTLKHSVLWFMNKRGVLLSKPVTGDFRITANVHAAKSSDPSQAPGGDGTVQLGGLMARNGDSPRENYVFVVLGDDGDGLSVETKNTTDGMSVYQGPAWDFPDAQLRLCRVGQTFNLYKRHIDSSEAWELADSFERPDLPESLQVGLNIYTANKPDLQVRYDDIQIEPVSDLSACETD